MSTVMEIKQAIERLSPSERAELDALVWPHEVNHDADRPDTPPHAGERLAEAANGRFLPGDRTHIQKILTSLG